MQPNRTGSIKEAGRDRRSIKTAYIAYAEGVLDH